MTDEFHLPAVVDPTKPNIARVYDYLLGGKDNFEVDRRTAERLLEIVPEGRYAMWENRDFLCRAVQYLTDEGVRQFIDIGTGLPTQNNVHEVAQREARDARVVYVDNDPVVVAHARALLARDDNVAAIQADLREPDKILNAPEVRNLIDFDRPVAVLMLAILHFISDEERPGSIIARFREALAPGSHLVISHDTADRRPADVVARILSVYKESVAHLEFRSHAQVTALFDGFELVPPGVVFLPEWRPDAPEPVYNPGSAWLLGGVGCKPGTPGETP